jgi:hypothetical protein
MEVGNDYCNESVLLLVQFIFKVMRNVFFWPASLPPPCPMYIRALFSVKIPSLRPLVLLVTVE